MGKVRKVLNCIDIACVPVKVYKTVTVVVQSQPGIYMWRSQQDKKKKKKTKMMEKSLATSSSRS